MRTNVPTSREQKRYYSAVLRKGGVTRFMTPLRCRIFLANERNKKPIIRLGEKAAVRTAEQQNSRTQRARIRTRGPPDGRPRMRGRGKTAKCAVRKTLPL